MQRAALLSLCALLASCERERPPPVPPDATLPDANHPDTGPVVVRDAGPPGPAIDGVIGTREWQGARLERASVATDRPGSELASIRALVEDDRLFVAIEGTMASGDAIVVYADFEPEGDGAAPGALADVDGAVDGALSEGRALSVPAGLAFDYGWGATLAPHVGVGLDDAIGWRDIASDPRTYAWIAAELAPSTCSESACETSIALGGARSVALFARIVRADGGFTNQTLPRDDPARPQSVSALLVVGEAPVPDAGVPVDGGGTIEPIVIDGVIGAAEWAGVEVLSSSTAPTGAFAGNTLRTLRVARDAERLYVAIEGALTAGNAIVAYVDHDVGGPDGHVSPTPFSDFVGALDRALSKSILTPAEVRLDFAWGTLDMPGSGAGDRIGWRDVGVADAFRAIASAPSACSRMACETSIALSELGVRAGADVGLFVRLVAATSFAFSNQTLPMDDPGAPESVGVYALVPAP